MINSKLGDQPTTFDSASSGWQTTLWREWCHAKDEEYAFYLFRLINQTVLGWKMIAAVSLWSALIAGIVGYWLGGVITQAVISLGFDLSTSTLAWLMAWGLATMGAVAGVWGSREFRSWYFWWQGQPPAAKVERALQQARKSRPEMNDIWAGPMEWAEAIKTQTRDPEGLVSMLSSYSWGDRFAARHALIAWGGEAIPALKKIAGNRDDPLWPLAIWILTSIEQETTNRFVWRLSETYCPDCLALFERHPVDLLLLSFGYYGCRICGQSQKFLYLPQGSVAVLDATSREAQRVVEGQLQINWLRQRELFDFNRVEIVQATDEDVERFAVQVGNDTDPFRRQRYQQIPCRVGSKCRLSENTLRILRRTFGQVEQERRLERLKTGKLINGQAAEQ